MENVSCSTLWEHIRNSLSSEFGKTLIDSWASSITQKKLEDGIFTLEFPNRFSRDWVHQHYYDAILSAAKKIDNSIVDVDICINESEQGSASSKSTSQFSTAKGGKNPADFDFYDDKHPSDDVSKIGIALDPELTFENFVVGKPNEFAYAAALRVAEADSVVFNPLFLYGGVGLGKTHLMHAIAWAIKRRNPERNVVYISAEKFMYHFIKAVRYKDTMDFKDSFRSVDVLMIDDIQFICGKDSTQEEFFHTFNTLVDNRHQVIISADKSPSDLEGMEERLKSRLGWGLVADIHPTSYELRLGILQNKASSSRVNVPNKVLEFLAEKITSNIRELEGALNRIIANSELIGRAITLESAREVLADLIRSNDRKVTVEDIQRVVANHFSIKLSDMSSSSRLKQIAFPRQVAMYLAKQLTSLSFPDVGRKFGGRDHTTVLHSVKKVEELIKNDANFADEIKFLITSIEP